jgi:hypothetical protein
MGASGQCHVPATLSPRKTRYPLYRRLGGPPQGQSGWVRKNLAPKMSYTGIFQTTCFNLSKNFWSSEQIINLINYFCCNLYCILLLLCYFTVFDFGDCSVDICLFVYCVCFLFFLTSFMSDCLYNRICGPMK